MNRGPLIRLIGALIILVFVLAGYGIWYSLLSQKSEEVASLAAEIVQESNATSKIDQAKAELSQLSSQEASVNQYFVATSDIVPFLEQIQAIGTFLGSKVEVVSVSATPATATVPFGQLSLSLNITGSFDAVARTIGSIEYGPYDTSITSLNFNTTATPGTTAPGSAPVWTASATFVVGAQTGNTVVGAGTNAAQASPAPTASTSLPINQSLPASTTASSSAKLQAQ